MAKDETPTEREESADPVESTSPDSPILGAGRPKSARADSRRCRAKKRGTDERCGNWAIKGGTVCKYHGGASPQVQRSARLRLMSAVIPSIERLEKERDNAKRPADRIRAAVSILDRAGYGPRVTLELEESRQLLVERLMALREEAEKSGALKKLAAKPDDDVVDVEPEED